MSPQDVLKMACQGCSLVCLDTNARLAAYWEFDPLTQKLRVASYHKDIHTFSGKDQASLKLLCDEAALHSEVASGEGAVGSVHKNQQAESFDNMMKLPYESFIHNYLADQVGVKHVTMQPFLNGVLE